MIVVVTQTKMSNLRLPIFSIKKITKIKSN